MVRQCHDMRWALTLLAIRTAGRSYVCKGQESCPLRWLDTHIFCYLFPVLAEKENPRYFRPALPHFKVSGRTGDLAPASAPLKHFHTCPSLPGLRKFLHKQLDCGVAPEHFPIKTVMPSVYTAHHSHTSLLLRSYFRQYGFSRTVFW